MTTIRKLVLPPWVLRLAEWLAMTHLDDTYYRWTLVVLSLFSTGTMVGFFELLFSWLRQSDVDLVTWEAAFYIAWSVVSSVTVCLMAPLSYMKIRAFCVKDASCSHGGDEWEEEMEEVGQLGDDVEKVPAAVLARYRSTFNIYATLTLVLALFDTVASMYVFLSDDAAGSTRAFDRTMGVALALVTTIFSCFSGLAFSLFVAHTLAVSRIVDAFLAAHEHDAHTDEFLSAYTSMQRQVVGVRERWGSFLGLFFTTVLLYTVSFSVFAFAAPEATVVFKTPLVLAANLATMAVLGISSLFLGYFIVAIESKHNVIKERVCTNASMGFQESACVVDFMERRPVSLGFLGESFADGRGARLALSLAAVLVPAVLRHVSPRHG